MKRISNTFVFRFKSKTMPRERGQYWRYFQEEEGDFSWVKCLECSTRISRGKSGSQRKDLNSSAMKSHLKRVHKEMWVQLEGEDEERRQAASVAKERRKEKDETAKSTVKIFNLRTAEEKEIVYSQA